MSSIVYLKFAALCLWICFLYFEIRPQTDSIFYLFLGKGNGSGLGLLLKFRELIPGRQMMDQTDEWWNFANCQCLQLRDPASEKCSD